MKEKLITYFKYAFEFFRHFLKHNVAYHAVKLGKINNRWKVLFVVFSQIWGGGGDVLGRCGDGTVVMQ